MPESQGIKPANGSQVSFAFATVDWRIKNFRRSFLQIPPTPGIVGIIRQERMALARSIQIIIQFRLDVHRISVLQSFLRIFNANA